mgnify:CR=1 FL=1
MPLRRPSIQCGPMTKDVLLRAANTAEQPELADLFTKAAALSEWEGLIGMGPVSDVVRAAVALAESYEARP